MHQKDVAHIVNVTTSTVTNWEKNRTSPRLYLLPKVFRFFGYDPVPPIATTTGEKIREYRRNNGLSIKKLAKELGVDPTTLARWEKGDNEPGGRLKKELDLFLLNLTK